MLSELEREYIDRTSLSYRKKMGQFFTPYPVSDFMVGWLLDQGAENLHDPCFGLGKFYYSAKGIDQKVGFSAIEIDKNMIEGFKNNGLDIKLDNKNYLKKWDIEKEAIVCNPPYNKFHEFEEKELIRELVKKGTGVDLLGYVNISSVFLIKSIHDLIPGGKFAYIMPMEFLSTGYGKEVKGYLLDNLKELKVIKINNEKEVFPDALTTIGILMGEKASENETLERIDFYSVDSPSELDELKKENSGYLRNSFNGNSLPGPETKWNKFFNKKVTNTPKKRPLVPLSYYGRFSRGIATGANKFFSLRPSEVERLGLEQDVSLCLTRSEQVKQKTLKNEDLETLIDSDSKVYVLNINGEASDAAKEYIKYGEEMGYSDPYLCRNRKKWYRIEQKGYSPILISVFSRGGYKVIRNFTKALHLTCFHGFHPDLFGQDLIDHLFLFFLSSTGKELVCEQKREYGGKLDKFEPKDLNDVLVPGPEVFSKIDPSLLKCAFQEIEREGRVPQEVEAIFDNC